MLKLAPSTSVIEAYVYNSFEHGASQFSGIAAAKTQPKLWGEDFSDSFDLTYGIDVNVLWTTLSQGKSLPLDLW